MSYSKIVGAAILSTVGLLSGNTVFAQVQQTVTQPDAQRGLTNTAAGISRNDFMAGKAVTDPNKIIQAIPLNANEKESALTSIDRHISEEVEDLKGKIKKILPDELSVLSKTVAWTAEKQSALLVAFRAGDPAAVYAAWTQGNPQDTAGAEIVARQTDVRRMFSRIEQTARNHAVIAQDLMELETLLGKIATATPGAAEVATGLTGLKTWVEVRTLVDAVVPDNALAAKLPTGKVPLIYDPSLPIGKAIVLGLNGVMIGMQGKGPITIRPGIAAEALGMPIVTTQPVRDAEGQEITSGILLVNPPNSGGTITYNVDGNRYVMEAGMTQELPGVVAERTVDYDRGGGFGVAGYTVTQGTYHFTPTENGWQLYKQRFDVVLDNSQSTQEFNFLFGGQKMVVPANGTRTISSIYPMVIRYDRGNGTEIATKLLNFSGTVQIGANVVDNRWDIFPTNNNQRAISNLKLFN